MAKHDDVYKHYDILVDYSNFYRMGGCSFRPHSPTFST